MGARVRTALLPYLVITFGIVWGLLGLYLIGKTCVAYAIGSA